MRHTNKRDQRIRQLRANASTASILASRHKFAQRIGYAFGDSGTDRDYYAVLGYSRNPTAEDYLARYRFQDVAKAVVNLPPQDTWKNSPVLIDGEERSDQDKVTSKFLLDWQALTESGGEIRALHYFERVDRLARIGQLAVMLVGCKDGAVTLDLPVQKNMSGISDLLYLSVFSEVSINNLDAYVVMDEKNPRFGKPEFYDIDLSSGLPRGKGITKVHYSRIIHVAEDLLEDDVYGLPSLESVINRLEDLFKVVGGAAEATWKLMRKGVVMLAQEGFTLPDDATSKAAFDDEIYKMEHDLARVFKFGGVDIKDLGSDVVDPDKIFAVIMDCISIATRIPKRILMGSERGQLASDQDERAWAGVIKSRQTKFAEPFILRAFVNWCVRNGIIAAPKSGKYKVEWPELYEMSQKEKAETANQLSSAIVGYINATGVVDVVDPNEFRKRVLGWPERDDLEPVERPDPETPEDQAAFDDTQRALDEMRNGNGTQPRQRPETLPE